MINTHLPCIILHTVIVHFIVIIWGWLPIQSLVYGPSPLLWRPTFFTCPSLFLLAGMKLHRKKQFPSPNTLTEILPRTDNLDSNNETELTSSRETKFTAPLGTSHYLTYGKHCFFRISIHEALMTKAQLFGQHFYSFATDVLFGLWEFLTLLYSFFALCSVDTN